MRYTKRAALDAINSVRDGLAAYGLDDSKMDDVTCCEVLDALDAAVDVLQMMDLYEGEQQS